MHIDLVAMPWAIFNRPSIQLGSLSSYLTRHLESCRVTAHHPYLEVAERIGLDIYQQISADSWAGEALYSSLLFPDHRAKAQNLFTKQLGNKTNRTFETISEQLYLHLRDWQKRVDFSSSKLVGFTVCFSQLLSSLYAAKLIKEQYSNLPIVLGGSTCTPEAAATFLNVFPFIDYIVVGEGEKPLLALARYIAGEDRFPAANVMARGREVSAPFHHSCQGNSTVSDLNTLPVPDYSDYFKELTLQRSSFIPSLPVEFSRGCWWNKCAFCNLNVQWHGYRFKQHKRMLAEVASLLKTYRCLDFCFTDNALPTKEADGFFNNIAQQDCDLHFFAEIRALNKPVQYKEYKAGGLGTIQVGIEAFSQSLLRKMNKGVTLMENIMAMKCAAEFDMQLEGNLIMEFPGSTAKEVQETLDTLDAVLPFAPLKPAGFFLGYGSPVHQDPVRFGIKSIVPHPGNRALFPEKVLNRLEMLINSYRGDRVRQKKLWQPVRAKIKSWHDFHRQRLSTQPPLAYRDGGHFLIIRQERPDQPVFHHRLQGQSRAIYIACRLPVTKNELLLAFSQINKEQLEGFLDDLVAKHLLFKHDDTYMALAFRLQKPLENNERRTI